MMKMAVQPQLFFRCCVEGGMVCCGLGLSLGWICCRSSGDAPSVCCGASERRSDDGARVSSHVRSLMVRKDVREQCRVCRPSTLWVVLLLLLLLLLLILLSLIDHMTL